MLPLHGLSIGILEPFPHPSLFFPVEQELKAWKPHFPDALSTRLLFKVWELRSVCEICLGKRGRTITARSRPEGIWTSAEGQETDVRILPAFPGNHLLESYRQWSHQQVTPPEMPNLPDFLNISSNFFGLCAIHSSIGFVNLWSLY